MPTRIMQAYKRFHSELRKRFSYGAYVGQVEQYIGGIPQGCPFSPEALKSILHLWLMVVSELGGQARLGANCASNKWYPNKKRRTRRKACSVAIPS